MGAFGSLFFKFILFFPLGGGKMAEIKAYAQRIVGKQRSALMALQNGKYVKAKEQEGIMELAKRLAPGNHVHLHRSKEDRHIVILEFRPRVDES